MLPGQGDLLMREWDRQDRERERSMRFCQECLDDCHEDDLIDGLCEDCDDRMRPRCDWCGELAASVVDVYVDAQHIERIAVCSEACAIGSKDESHPPLIDTVVDAADLQRVISASPCWCEMRKTTVLQWCPKHGTKKE
jgi:hypothetical protein